MGFSFLIVSEVGDAFRGGFLADTDVHIDGVWLKTFDISIITSVDVEIEFLS